MPLCLCLLLSIFIHNSSSAQTTAVSGTILDAETGEPMAFATVVFTGTTIGVTSDFNGNYSLTTTQKVDSVSASFMGYETNTKVVLRGQKNKINFDMLTEKKEVGVVRVSAKGDAARKLIRGVQKAKAKQNKNNLSAYQYEAFTKIQFAINNISEKYKKKKVIKKLGPLFDTISYLSEDREKAVLPVFISEVISDFYFADKPARNKEVIRGSRIKGVGVEDGTFVSQLLGSSFQQYNFHDNILNILTKNFVSPISTHSLSFYNYTIVDITYENGLPINQIKVEPKNPLDLAFTGYIWIEDSTFALTRVSLSVPSSANLNYVEKLKITQEYLKMDNGVYMPNKTRILIDIVELSKNSAGMIALFNSTAENIVINEPKEDKFYDYPVVTSGDITNKSDTFWENNRHDTLTKDELRVSNSIDSLTNLPMIKNWVEFLNIVIDGYLKVGKVDLGPYAFLYGYNALEGNRFRLGFRTNYDFSKKFIFKGYGAYGTSDEKWKYMGEAEAILSRKRWTTLGFQQRKDVDQIGVTDNDYGASNLFTALSISNANQLNRTFENKLWFASEFRKGWNVRLAMHSKELSFEPINDFNFKYRTNPLDTSELASDFTTSEASIELRWAPKEYFLANDNERVRVSRQGDLAVSIKYAKGINGLFNSQFDYDKIVGRLNYGFNFGYLGITDLEFEVLKVFGDVPYPLLNVHRGNQSFIYGKQIFNLMNFFEFVSDESVSLFAEHHFNGALLNRIPLMKKLKWRLVLAGKGSYGSMTKSNQSLVPNYDLDGVPVSQFKQLNKTPYGEVGFGVENIFKVLRVDFLKRLTHLKDPGVDEYGIMASLAFAF